MKLLRRVRTREEDGVAAVWVALILVVLFGFTALAVDAGRAYTEVRELQTAADVSAMSAAQLLMTSETAAEAAGQYYVTNNPTLHHPGAYNTATGDLVDAKLIASGTGCAVNGITYDCVESTVVAPAKSEDPDGFEWLFARALGFDETSLKAEATAVLGGGAPGGEKLVPWVTIDCPLEIYEGADYAAALAKVNSIQPGRCPYTYSTLGWDGPRIDLFLDTASSEEGNFQGIDLAVEPCDGNPATPDGLFPKGGGAADYEDLLAGLATDDVVPCNVARGARVYPKTGVMVGPTKQGLEDRGVSTDTCANEASFNNALVDPDLDGVYQILDHSNPCLIALILGVHINTAYPGVETDIPGGCCVTSMQHPDATDSNNDESWRFAAPGNGTATPLLVRRFATFYITELGNSKKPYRGIFLRTLDSGNASLDSKPCTAADGICVVKMVLSD